MKQLKYPLLAGAVWLLGAGPIVQAQSPSQTVTTPATQGNFADAQSTWKDVREGTRTLDDLIAKRQLGGVHDAALSLRDSVRELRFGWGALNAEQKASTDATIRKVDGLIDGLHESGDHNDLKGAVEGQRTLHVLLDTLAASFPRNVLAPVGAVTSEGAVKDPYCRMTVDPATAAAKVVYNGQTYYFCSVKEARLFGQNPAPYARLFDDLTFGKPKVYAVSVSPQGKVQAGHVAKLTFAVREQGQNVITTQFQTVHEKLMHLIAVSDDLSWFGHLHPEQAKDGRFYLEQTFPREGRYFLFSDFTPRSGSNTIARSEISVGSGITRQPQKLVADSVLSQTIEGIRVDLKLSAPLRAGQQTLLTYSLSRGGKPVADMTPYLGAMGHLMAISADGQTALHTHAVSSGSDPVTGLSVTDAMATQQGPTQTFKVEMPRGGLFKVWAQFGVNGRTLTVPFTFDVQENPQMKTTKATAILAATASTMGAASFAQNHTQANIQKGTAMKGSPVAGAPKNAQRITITLPQGYTNASTTVKAGQPVALTFFLKSDAGCGNTVSVPAAKWTGALRVGERKTVVYTPKQSGTLAFQCSMGHLKGSIKVK